MARTGIIAIALLASAAIAAPVPPLKPGLSKEQQEQFDSAEADLAVSYQAQMAVHAKRNNREGITRDDIRKMGETIREFDGKAAEKLTRLHATMTAAPRALRHLVGVKTGRALAGTGDPRKGLGYFESVIKESTDPKTRIDAIFWALQCHMRLRNVEKVPALVALARQELPRLGKKEQEERERSLQRAERMSKMLKP